VAHTQICRDRRFKSAILRIPRIADRLLQHARQHLEGKDAGISVAAFVELTALYCSKYPSVDDSALRGSNGSASHSEKNGRDCWKFQRFRRVGLSGCALSYNRSYLNDPNPGKHFVAETGLFGYSEVRVSKMPNFLILCEYTAPIREASNSSNQAASPVNLERPFSA
jgi:hypothetical protein